MANIKVSELPETSTTEGVLILASVPDGIGGYLSRFITYENLFIDTINSSNLKKNVVTVGTGKRKITFTGDAFAVANYSLNFTCRLNGLETPLELISKEVDGFTIDNTTGVSVEVDYQAYKL